MKSDNSILDQHYILWDETEGEEQEEWDFFKEVLESWSTPTHRPEWFQ